jgi:dihydroorotase
MVARDIMLAEYTRAHIHIAHVSTRGSVELIRAGKDRGVHVTCDTAPHYFTLEESMLRTYDTNLKINPPLRRHEDVAAIKDGLKDGTIDAIATDHAPHTRTAKEVEFDQAPPGIVGLETALGLVLTELVEPGTVDLSRAVATLTSSPARVAGLPTGTLRVGSPADVTIFDPNHSWTCDPTAFESKSKNSPFGGRLLKGRVDHVLIDGRLVMKAGRLLQTSA